MIRLSDSQPPGFWQPPQPHSQPPHAQPPMIYVYENQAWEYKIVVRNKTLVALPSEQELNVLGMSGWELAGVVTLPDSLHFYFKRSRT